MKYFKNLVIRWLPCCLIFFVIACQQKSGYKDMQPTKQDTLDKIAYLHRAYDSLFASQKFVKNGDIITRTGNDFTSQSLKTLNQRNKTYSHCGIASIEHDSVFVYHALGGEFNPDQKIRRDTYESFTEPYNNNNLGIFRFSLPDTAISKLVATAKEFYNRGIMFDMDFSLTTDERMYCAEYVYKSFLRAPENSLAFPLSHINTFQFIGVDDIFLHPQCRPVKEIKYK